MIQRLIENATQLFLLLVLAPLVTGVIRTLKARLQTRRGPGILQPYRDLRKLFGTAFDEYAARVPLFFPAFTDTSSESASAPASPASGFSWAQYRRNREYQALIGTIAGLGIVGLRMWIRARFGY